MADIRLSIVIPAFNEGRRLGATLERIREYAVTVARPCELIIVDDGSTDDTAAVVRAFDHGPLTPHLLVSDTNRGKGHAVRRGMLAATGELVLMCDADLSTPIEEVERLMPWIERGWDVVIGSRDVPDSRLERPQPLVRRSLALAFRALRRPLLLPGLRDTQCGFKLLRREAAQAVFSRATLDGWLFDCEMLGIAERLGYRIREVGVLWRNHPDSRVEHWREMLTAVPTLLAIRRRLRAAAYNQTSGVRP